MDKIIVSGQSSKIGKTFLVEEIIPNLSGRILAIKAAVSENLDEAIFSIENNETKNIKKDTGRFLKAGADKAVYFKSDLQNFNKNLNQLDSKIKENFDYIIYEGNNIIDFINPNIIIFLKKDGLEIKSSAKKALKKADIILDYSNGQKTIFFNNDSIVCYKAFLLANILGLELKQITKLLNKSKIKVKGCQLGLF